MGEEEKAIRAVLRAEAHEEYHHMELFQLVTLENIERLKKIYGQSKDKKKIISSFSKYKYFNEIYLIFEFLIRNNEIELAFEVLKNISKAKNDIQSHQRIRMYNICIGRLIRILDTEKFSSNNLESLREYILYSKTFLPHFNITYEEGQIDYSHKLISETIKIIDLQIVRIVDKIYDKEILSEDIDKLSKKIKKLGLSEEVALSFKKLEERYYQARDKIDFATFSSPIRTTLSSLVKEIANKIAELKRDKIEGKEDKNYRNYLEKKGLMHKGINGMIKNLYSFLSGKINHKVSTEQEYYKRGLNIASQIALLLVTEYERTLPIRKIDPSLKK